MQGPQDAIANVALGLRCRTDASEPSNHGAESVVQLSVPLLIAPQFIPHILIPLCAGDLEDWGYEMFDASPAYRDFSDGGYWGIAPWLQQAGISDKCVQEGGKWRASAILHWDPTKENETPKKEQTYWDPEDEQRRVGWVRRKMCELWLTVEIVYWCFLLYVCDARGRYVLWRSPCAGH